MEIEDLKKQLNDNTNKIIENIKKIENNATKIENNSGKIQKNSYALDILKDYKKGFNRWHNIALIFMVLWIITMCYLVYTLNDISNVETSQEITDVDTISGNVVNNGDIYGENYGEYGRDSYGRRGYDMKYRGDEELDRMAGEYGRYMESRSRYGAGEETDKSFHYMVKALEDFIMVLKQEADSQEQKQQLMQALQNSMR